EGSGTTAHDSTSSHNDGTLGGIGVNFETSRIPTWVSSAAPLGQVVATGTNSDFQFTPDDNGSFAAVLQATDANGAGTTSANVAVTNVAPTATFGTTGTLTEGGSASVTFTNQFDPSGADTAAGFTYSYDFNNDNTFEITNSTSPTAAIPADLLADG